MASYKNLLPNYSNTTSLTPVTSDSGLFDWTTGFAKSALESIPELIGITPSQGTIDFRQDNPVTGFISQLAGFAVPYAGWFKASKLISPLERTIAKIGDLEKTPFTTGAARELTRYAPFEVGRLATSQVVGDESFDSMLADTAISLAAAGGIGGIFTGIGAAGARRTARKALIPGVDIGLPIQLQMRQISKMIPDAPPELKPRLGYKLEDLRRESRAESLGKIGKYLAPLEGDLKGDRTKSINRLFRNQSGKTVLQRRFVEAQGDFSKKAEWKAEASLAGLPESFEDLGQFFRHISFRGTGKIPKAKASEIDHAITRNLESIGDNWYIGKEADDGLFVLARKTKGAPGKADPGDSWVLFKTDQPGTFAKTPQKWIAAQTKIGAWNLKGEIAADGGDIYNSVAGFVKNFPLHNYKALSKPGVFERLLPKNIGKPMNEFVGRIGEAAKEYIAPAVHQFKNSPRANWVWAAARAAYDAAESKAQTVLFGVQRAHPGKSIFAQAMRNKYDVEQSAAIKQILDPLSDKDIEGLHHVWRNNIKPDQLDTVVGQGVITPAAAGAARQIDTVMTDLRTSLHKARGASSEDELPEAPSLGLFRTWQGDSRVPIRDEGGRVVAIASGVTRKQALRVADEIAAENPTWVIGDEFNITDLGSIPKDLAVHVRSPSFILERQNVRGFQWDKDTWNRQELMQALTASVQGQTKHQADLSVKHILQPHLDQLAQEDRVSHRLLVSRLNDLAGVQSAFSRVQNQIADTVLAPMLGTNSASKIVAFTNNAMWHLQLGGLKLSYPIINLMQFVQTVMPEVAYLMTAAPAQLAGRYTHFAAGGTRGPVGGMAILSPFAVMKDSVRAMRKPSADLSEAFARAQNERVIDPRLVEEYIGESATKVSDLKKALSSGGGFVGWVRALSEFLPAQSERMSRAHAFTSGYVFAKDYMKLEGENLYRFARQFTENTMYMYQASDRPRIFTTPAGSAFGLFKNWMANYISTMLEYTGEGLVRNNWTPLLWQTAGTAAVGGLAATPLALAAGAFTEAWSDKSLLQTAYDEFGESADGLMFGLPAALTGVSLYSQVSSPAANPVRDASMMFGVATLDRMTSLGKTVGAAFDHWQSTGEHPGRNPRVREQLIRTFAPVTLYRIFGAMEEQKIRSLSSGYPMQTNVSVMDRVLYSAGFNPTAYDREMAVANELFADRTKRRAAVAKLGEAWANAQQNGDSDQMRTILRQATVWGVDTSSVIKSGMARISKTKEETVDRNFKPEDIQAFGNVLGPQ